MATIALATEYSPKKFIDKMFVSQKLDGVPIKILIDEFGTVHHCTRQNTQLKSIDHVLEAAADVLPWGVPFVGELYIPQTPFKDISGKVRGHDPAPELQFYIYDMLMSIPYSNRKANWERYTRIQHPVIKSVYQMPNGLGTDWCESLEDAHRAVEWANVSGVEGLVFRHPQLLPTEAGKRCKGFLKYKPKPTIDLSVVGFEEATSEAGAPLGMIGRINVLFNGEITGVGAGKLTHAERRQIFENPYAYIGKVAEIQYMRDPSYTALRQATFQRFRPDKDAPDA